MSAAGSRRRLGLFGHVARLNRLCDTSPVLRAEIPRDWKRPKGRARSTLVSTVEKDLSLSTSESSCPEEGGGQSKLEEDHLFGDAPLVGACRKEEGDIVRSTDAGFVSALVLLDLSEAFDTVDHGILLDVLTERFDVENLQLDWFRSYHNGCTQTFITPNGSLTPVALTCSVPQ